MMFYFCKTYDAVFERKILEVIFWLDFFWIEMNSFTVNKNGENQMSVAQKEIILIFCAQDLTSFTQNSQ